MVSEIASNPFPTHHGGFLIRKLTGKAQVVNPVGTELISEPVSTMT